MACPPTQYESTPTNLLNDVPPLNVAHSCENTQTIEETIEPIICEEVMQHEQEADVSQSERPRRLAAMRGIDRIESTLGGKEHISYRRKLGLFQKRQQRLTHRAQVCLMMKKIR